MTLASALKRVLKYEGGYSNLAADRGGATNKGITQSEYDKYRRDHGWASRSVKLISDDEVAAIYEGNYWVPTKAQWLPDPLAYVMFDTGVLMGVGTAKKLLNRALGLGWQGANWTPLTSDRLWKTKSMKDLAKAVCDEREKRLRAIVAGDETQEIFLDGWMNRLNDIRQYVERGF